VVVLVDGEVRWMLGIQAMEAEIRDMKKQIIDIMRGLAR
jgi:hypothetical protein